MLALKISARFVAGSCLSAALAFNAMAQPAPAFEPKVGQRGKDVVWVPTNQKLVDKMLDMAKVTPSDYLMDLGSGDGRTVITAAKRGATAKGIEYNPDMVELSKSNAEKAGVTAKASFEKADLFETDFSKATVITMFLLPSINLKLRPTLLDMKPGTRHRVELVRSRRLDRRRDRFDQRRGLHLALHRLFLAGAGQGRGQMADAAGRTDARAEIPGCVGHAEERQRDRAGDRRQADRQQDRIHRRRHALYRHGRRLDDHRQGQ